MPTAFESRPLTVQSFMQRLLRQHPIENAIVELNNLLATQPVLSIQPADLTTIEQRYGLSLHQFRLNLEEFYAVHLNYLLDNQLLASSGLAELTHLQTLFQLPAQSVEMLHQRLGEIAFRQRAEKAVHDGQITTGDKAALVELQRSISLPSDLADSIYKEVCQAHLNQFVQAFSSDARLTPSEDQRLQSISQNLGVKLTAEDKRSVERFKRYWSIENTVLPVVETNIALQKSELCHFYSPNVQWYEERATARRTSYSDHYEQGKSYDAINLYSNADPIQKVRFAVLKRINTGNLYLTNKRIIFEAPDKTTSVKLVSIVRIDTYKQGILVDKSAGKPMLLIMSRDTDKITLLINRLLNSLTTL